MLNCLAQQMQELQGCRGHAEVAHSVGEGIKMQAQQNPREMRGLAIASTDGMVTPISEITYRVRSQTNSEMSYLVTKLDHQINRCDWRCECADYRYRHVVCKHIHSVRLSQLLRAKAESKNFGFAIDLNEPSCLSCGAKELIKSGLRKNKYGEVQRYKCKSCGFRFTVNLGFQKMKNSPKIITLVMDLWANGMSSRKISRHLQQFYELSVDQRTVLRYVERYTKVIKEFVDSITPQLSGIWHADETLLNIKDTERIGMGFYSYAWACMDSQTRFLLACEISKHRGAKDGVKMFRKAQSIANGKPMAIITDSYRGYNDAIKDVFYTNTKPRPVHIKSKAIKHGMDNVRMERHFGELKNRTKTMRGLGNDKGAQTYADLHRINHNFVKPHMSLNNQTPAQVAGIDLPLGNNKWLGLIKISAKHSKK